VFAAPKSIQATVTLLENLHIILEKTPPEDVRTEVLPMLFNAFESSTLQVQVSERGSFFFCSFPVRCCGASIPRAFPHPAASWNYTLSPALFACALQMASLVSNCWCLLMLHKGNL
jgi:hypothetical protein